MGEPQLAFTLLTPSLSTFCLRRQYPAVRKKRGIAGLVELGLFVQPLGPWTRPPGRLSCFPLRPYDRRAFSCWGCCFAADRSASADRHEGHNCHRPRPGARPHRMHVVVIAASPSIAGGGVIPAEPDGSLRRLRTAPRLHRVSACRRRGRCRRRRGRPAPERGQGSFPIVPPARRLRGLRLPRFAGVSNDVRHLCRVPGVQQRDSRCGIAPTRLGGLPCRLPLRSRSPNATAGFCVIRVCFFEPVRFGLGCHADGRYRSPFCQTSTRIRGWQNRK